MAEKDRLRKIEEALVRAHRARPEVEPGTAWNMRVMAGVRGQQNTQSAEARDAVAVQRFVWRFAAAACAVALAVSVYAATSGIGPEQLAMRCFFNDPFSTLTMRIFIL